MELRIQRLCIVAFVGALIIMMTAARGTENRPRLASEKSTPPGAGAPRDAQPQTSDDVQELEEIEEIRREVTSPLQGSVFGPTDHAPKSPRPRFAEAYRRIAAQVDRSEPHAADLEDVPADFQSENNGELVAQLRNTAAWLDEQANLLECGRHYRRADRLRRLAEQVRRTARQEDRLGQ